MYNSKPYIEFNKNKNKNIADCERLEMESERESDTSHSGGLDWKRMRVIPVSSAWTEAERKS